MGSQTQTLDHSLDEKSCLALSGCMLGVLQAD